MPNLTNIYLQANHLTELPDAVQYLHNLETLDVSCNQLTKIPATIGKLKKLSRIILTQNQISDLPQSMEEMISLKSLHLNRNCLRELPYFLHRCFNLRELCLDQNLLTTLPNFLTRLPNLHTLSVCSNRLISLPHVPFAAIRRFHCDNNPNLSYLPYPVACQMNRTPERPLATRNVLHISCHGCFKVCGNPNVLVGSETRIHFTGIPLSRSDLPSLAELALRSIMSSVFPKPIDFSLDQRNNLHSYKSTYHNGYDELVNSLSVPFSLIRLLRDGPYGFCHNCRAFVFTGPACVVFLPKVLVQEHLHNFIQPVVCSVLFCSSACSRTITDDDRLEWVALSDPN